MNVNWVFVLFSWLVERTNLHLGPQGQRVVEVRLDCDTSPILHALSSQLTFLVEVHPISGSNWWMISSEITVGFGTGDLKSVPSKSKMLRVSISIQKKNYSVIVVWIDPLSSSKKFDLNFWPELFREKLHFTTSINGYHHPITWIRLIRNNRKDQWNMFGKCSTSQSQLMTHSSLSAPKNIRLKF